MKLTWKGNAAGTAGALVCTGRGGEREIPVPSVWDPKLNKSGPQPTRPIRLEAWREGREAFECSRESSNGGRGTVFIGPKSLRVNYVPRATAAAAPSTESPVPPPKASPSGADVLPVLGRIAKALERLADLEELRVDVATKPAPLLNGAIRPHAEKAGGGGVISMVDRRAA